MHIGLIGGIGPAATDLYYRGLIDAMKGLNSELQLTIAHADAPTLLRNFEAKQPDIQAEIYLGLTQRLAIAGAEVVAITSIGGHFCIEEFRPLSPLPIIDLIATMDSFLADQKFFNVGLIGTNTVMRTKFYGGIKSSNVLTPTEEEIDTIHQAYVGMALTAKVNQQQSDIMFAAGQNLVNRGVEVVLLGGTDLFLAFDDQNPGYKTIDCAKVHIDAIAQQASEK
jgi:aspartate racemase